jgi:hypothetical protein
MGEAEGSADQEAMRWLNLLVDCSRSVGTREERFIGLRNLAMFCRWDAVGKILGSLSA